MNNNFYLNILKSLIIIIICLACTSHNKETEKKVAQFMGDTLQLPGKTEFLYKDSLYKKGIPVDNKAKIKIPTLLWGECHSCIADLKKWEDFYEFVEKTENDS
jgi:hypothetical protein